jgi:hypothetical protein
LLVSGAELFAQQKPIEESKSAPVLVPEFLHTGSWASLHNLTSRTDFKLTAPKAGLALRLEVLDRRPASSFHDFSESFGGKTSGKTLTQPGLGLYHINTESRLLYGILDTQGLPARIRNVWIRGAPYAENRNASSAELRTTPSSTAKPQSHIFLESPVLSLGTGEFSGFGYYSVYDDAAERAPAFGMGAEYVQGKKNFRLEGFYTRRTLPERKSSTWFNERPALPERDTRLFAGSTAFSVPAFGLAVDLAYSETFAFGKDYYNNLGLRFGDKPWRFSLALDLAGDRYVDSAGNVPGAGFRAAARLERRGKKTGLFRLNTLTRGPGPKNGLLKTLEAGDFAAIKDNFNRTSGEVYYRFPVSSAGLRLTRFSFSMDRDSRDEKKVLDSAGAMASINLGPLSLVNEGKITRLNRQASTTTEGNGHSLNSYRLSQSLSWTIPGSIFQKSGRTEINPPKLGGSKSSGVGKKAPFNVVFSARAGFRKEASKDGVWDSSISASLRSKKSRLTIKAATPAFPDKWEYTISWRMQF